MPTPREIFDDPDRHFELLTAPQDSQVESQSIDRKQAPTQGGNGAVQKSDLDGLINQAIETVSAFANTNRTGGLLIIGIAKNGEVLGVDHLNEQQRSRLTSFDGKLRNEGCQVRSHVFSRDPSGKQVLFIYVPYTTHAICETAGNDRRAWLRHDQQNIVLTPERRAVVEREKGIAQFENIHWRPFAEEDIDIDLLNQFRQSYLQDSSAYHYGTPELLRKAGAVERGVQGNLHLTNAGILFFGSNPQERFSRTYIRLMKFDGRYGDATPAGLPHLDQKFDGPLTAQLRSIRAFLQSSGFFKTYQRRNVLGPE